MSTGKRKEKKKKNRTKMKRSKTLTFNRKNFKKYDTKRKRRTNSVSEKELQKQLKEERKRIEKERRKLESDKKQLKNAKNKLQNEQQKLSKITKRKSIKDLNTTKRFQLEIDEYKQQIHSLKKYKKQIHTMKKKQSKKRLHKNEKVKYIWTENIKQIKVLNKNKGISILFDGDDNERIFTDIGVILPSKLMENNKIINYLLNELNDRIDDIKSLRYMINYTQQNEIESFVNNKILPRHCENKPRFIENNITFLSKMRQNNKLWRYALLQKEELKGSIFDIWLNAQNELKSGKNPEICVENGVKLHNIYGTEKKQEFNIDSARAMSARRYQKLINQKTDAMYFLHDHHGQYEYDEDEDLLESNEMKLNLLHNSAKYTPTFPSSNSLKLTPTYSNISNTSNTSNSHSHSHSHSTDMDDGNYQHYIDSLYQYISQQQRDLLLNIGVFLNKIIPNKYKPLCSYSNSDSNIKCIIYKLFDGQIFAEIINILQPDFIDLRCMEYDHDTEHKVSNYKENIIGNINVIINSIYALNLPYGIVIFSINPEKIEDLYFNALYTLSIIINICEYLIANYFNAEMNIYKYGELLRLCQNEEEQKSCNTWSYIIWLKRWLLFIKHPKLKHNRSKKRRKSQLKHSIDLKDHLDCHDMENLTQSRSRSGSKSNNSNRLELNRVIEDEKMSLTDNSSIATNNYNDTNDYMNDIKMVYKTLDVEIDIKESESEYKNSYYLQQMILIKMFKIKNNINKLSEKEKQSIKFVVLDGEDKCMISWINWMNSLNGFKWKNINNLYEDISDGLVILHLLTQCKNGCVDWKNVKKKIKKKFDKIANAKEILLICKRFKFKLIGITENNIVDANKKYIKSLLKQIKMYFLKEKMMTNLNIISENVNETDFDEIILKWTNKQFKQFKQNNKGTNIILHNDGKGILSLNDKSLSDCIYFFNLISCVNTCDKYLNYSLICKGKETENQIKNANYLLTVLRKLGCNLFASAYDIYHCKYDVILSVVSCIIHIVQKNE